MNAAIYARKSTEQIGIADEQKSVTRQIEHGRAYAHRKGWTVDDRFIFVDDGISGAEFANRPGYMRVLNALKPRPPFQVLIVSELSRLGREQLETGYALKQLSQAGVKVFGYLEDKEVLLDTPVDKFLMSAVSFAAEIEREKARQRTYDAMLRKARAGHVTGGGCFGYKNLEILDAAGRRSHVERVIESVEADVIQRIFRLAAEGYGLRAIGKLLNEQGAPSPRAQQGRSQSWAPTSVREVLFRSTYRGEIVWAQTAKRDRWGRKKQNAKPESEWIRRAAPQLRIVSDEAWTAAHQRLDASRRLYLQATNGKPFGRPMVNNPSRYLQTNFALCGCCRGSLKVLSRSHGHDRKLFYGCAGYHDRGRTVCTNNADVPMTDANAILIEALLDDVLDDSMLKDAIDEALRLVQGDGAPDRRARLDGEITKVDRERTRLVSAITTGGDIPGLVEALRDREATRTALEAERQALVSQRPMQKKSVDRIRDELLALAQSWRQVLSDDPTNARPIVAGLLKGRVSYTPVERGRWELRGEGTLAGLFSRTVYSTGDGVPNGIRTRVLALKGPRPGPLDDGDGR